MTNFTLAFAAFWRDDMIDDVSGELDRGSGGLI